MEQQHWTQRTVSRQHEWWHARPQPIPSSRSESVLPHGIVCNVCHAFLNGEIQFIEHIGSERHVRRSNFLFDSKFGLQNSPQGSVQPLRSSPPPSPPTLPPPPPMTTQLAYPASIVPAMEFSNQMVLPRSHSHSRPLQYQTIKPKTMEIEQIIKQPTQLAVEAENRIVLDGCTSLDAQELLTFKDQRQQNEQSAKDKNITVIQEPLKGCLKQADETTTKGKSTALPTKPTAALNDMHADNQMSANLKYSDVLKLQTASKSSANEEIAAASKSLDDKNHDTSNGKDQRSESVNKLPPTRFQAFNLGQIAAELTPHKQLPKQAPAPDPPSANKSESKAEQASPKRRLQRSHKLKKFILTSF